MARPPAGARGRGAAPLGDREDRRGGACACPRGASGIRVLGLTSVIAGPVCGRTLAGYGADVLNVSSKHLPNLLGLVIDTGLGKLSASLDLRQADDADRLRALV